MATSLQSPMTLLALAGALALAACQPQSPEAPSPPASADKANGSEADKASADKAGAGEAGKDAAKADPDACATYANTFCKEAGPSSSTCASMRSVSGFMAPEACQAGLDHFAHTKTALADIGKTCDELVKKLCADLGEQTQTCAMVKEMTPKFPPERCNEMMGQYPAVLAELKAEEEKNKPLSPDKQAAIAAKDAPAFGPEDARVTIVEFSDFQCPFCTRAASVTDKIKENYGGRVRVVFRQFPLSFHKDAHLAAQAAMAADAQGKFWEFHDLLFANQREIKREHLEQYAKQLGLDMARFKKALDEGTYKKHVDDDLAMGTSVAVDGTPTMFLNGTRVTNPTSYETVAAMIDKELEQAGKTP